MPSLSFYGSHTRIKDLRKGQYLAVRCGRCGHTGAVTPGSWPKGVSTSMKLVDLPEHLRCSRCGRRSIRTRVAVLQR